MELMAFMGVVAWLEIDHVGEKIFVIFIMIKA
jgi:hypothetical protein